MQFSEKLKLQRVKKGVSQAELAQNVFVSRSAVAKWENGLGIPSGESLRLLAEYFEVDEQELLSDPITEKVLVKQNSVLSKQKIWIISLSAVLAVALIVVIVLGILAAKPNQPYIPPEPYNPVITRELIFVTEKYLDTTTIVNYPDDEISATKTFAKTRVFELPQEGSKITLPIMAVKVTVDGEINYENVDYRYITVTHSDNIYTSCGWTDFLVYAKDYYADEFEDWLNIKYDGLLASVKVFRKPIDLTNLTIGFVEDVYEPMGTIGLTQSKELRCVIEPYNAAYADYRYVIERIVKPNGEKYTGDLSTYATIQNEYLTVTDKVEVNSSIYISAIADYYNVKSNLFVVGVLRVPIKRLSFGNYDAQSQVYRELTINSGESKLIELCAEPYDATFNVLNEQAELTLLNPNLGAIERVENGWILTASSEFADIGKKIGIRVDTPEGESTEFGWFIRAIPVESVVLLNAETGKEANEVIYLPHSSEMQFNAVVYPSNASYEKIEYYADVEYDYYIRFYEFDNGRLWMRENAPDGLEIFVTAIAGNVSSKVYKVIVKRIFVEEVVLSTRLYSNPIESNIEIAVGQSIKLYATYLPDNSGYHEGEYILLDDVEGVNISQNEYHYNWHILFRELSVTSDAVVGTQFRVKVIVDNVESNVLMFTVVAAT